MKTFKDLEFKQAIKRESIDKRERSAKELILRINNQAKAKANDFCDFDYSESIFMLRIKDVMQLLTVNNINLN